MNLYIWRHNKTYHSHSMINEPCVVNEFYLDALAIVEAGNGKKAGGWKTCGSWNPSWCR